MCGIAGILRCNMAVDVAVLENMVATMAHRGPDGRGVFVDSNLGLAHARLSIIDLEGGHQPMSVENGSVRIIFNGEIFNYIELRAELEKRGHRFITRSDTEVILRLYLDKGVQTWAVLRRAPTEGRDRLLPLFEASSNPVRRQVR